MFKLLSRKLLGEKYRSAARSLLIAVVIALSLSGLEYKIDMAQNVLILTGIVFAGTVILQTLGSKDNARCLRGLFSMPCNARRTLWEYGAAVGLYTLITKVSLLAALLFAFTTLTPLAVLLLSLSFLYALFGSMAAFGLFRKAPVISVLFAAAGIAMALLLPEGFTAAAVLGAADVIAAVVFSVLPFENFYVSPAASLKKRVRRGKPAARMLIPTYIARYLLENKNYLINTAGTIVISCYIALTAEKQGLAMGCGMGLAMNAINTPLAIIVSSNRGLKRKLDALPEKTHSFFIPYGAALFVIYLFCFGVYLASFAVAGGSVGVRDFLTLLLFAAESAVFVAVMEDRFTITKWNTEPDLWHNPRKYILPCVLMAEAALIYML